jgi:isocitrate dehydrogenase
MTKDNIMKHTDGLFHDVFNEIAAEYPDIQSDHYIIDIGSAMLADNPDRFDVVVTLNLYGDIISDITAQVAGSVGLGGSANIGEDFAMFEAIHGSAPDIAGKNIANPSGLLNGACMMLVHLGQHKVAEKIENALLRTLEDGVHTGDIYSEAYTTKRAGTREFAQAVIERLGQKPQRLKAVEYGSDVKPIQLPAPKVRPAQQKRLVGVDVFLDWTGNDRNPNVLGELLRSMPQSIAKLKMITNRGVKVFPDGMPETFCTDHWRCRYLPTRQKTAR